MGSHGDCTYRTYDAYDAYCPSRAHLPDYYFTAKGQYGVFVSLVTERTRGGVLLCTLCGYTGYERKRPINPAGGDASSRQWN